MKAHVKPHVKCMKICVNLNEDLHVKACVKPHVKWMWKYVWKGWRRFTPFSHIFHYAKFHMHVKYVCEMRVKSVWKTCEKHVKWVWKQDIFHTFFTWCFTYILLVVNGISQNHSNGKFIAMNVFCIKNINGFSSAFPLMYFNMLFYHFPLKKTRMIF